MALKEWFSGQKKEWGSVLIKICKSPGVVKASYMVGAIFILSLKGQWFFRISGFKCTDSGKARREAARGLDSGSPIYPGLLLLSRKTLALGLRDIQA